MMGEQNAGWVTCSTQITEHGGLCLVFEGYHPPGSEGAHVANKMAKPTLSAYSRTNPKAILFDFEKLDYVWGDGICLPAIRLGIERMELPLALPVCILAHGRTHQALKPLLRK